MTTLHIAPQAAVRFGKTSHGCTMLSMAARLEMASGTWLRPFLESASAEWASPLLEDMPLKTEADVLLTRNLLSKNRDAEIGQVLASQLNWANLGGNMSVVHLANPRFGADAVTEMLKSFPPPALASAALMANPNCPREHRRRDCLSMEHRRHYQEALSMYGDFSEQDTLAELTEILFPSSTSVPGKSKKDEQGREKHRGKCLWHLVHRQELPRNFAIELDSFSEGSRFEALAKTKAHRQLVKEGTLLGIKKPKEGTLMSLSPEITTERLSALFSEPAGSDVLCVIASHPNAAPELTKQIVECDLEEIPPFFAFQLVAKQIPGAAETIKAIRETHPDSQFPSNMSELENVSGALLNEAFKDVSKHGRWWEAAQIACNPKFPWKENQTLPNDLVSLMPHADMMGLQVARASAGIVTQEAFDSAMETSQDAPSVLFAPNLSSRRLEQLTGKYPSLTAFAAVHPNGFDVSLAGLATKERELVETIRPNPLSGASGTRGAERNQEVISI